MGNFNNIEKFDKETGQVDTTYTHETAKLDDVKKSILEIKELLNKGEGDKEILSKELSMLIDEQEKLEGNH